MRIIKERILSALLGVLFFIVFQPLDLPDGWLCWIFILLFCLSSVLCCIIGELIVTYLFRVPSDVGLGMAQVRKHYTLFSPINLVLQVIQVDVMFALFTDIPFFALGDITYIFICLLCVVIVQSLYWSNVYRNRIMALDLEEAWRINGALQERERLRKTDVHLSKETSAVTQVPKVLLEGTTRESLNLSINDFLFAESRGNYVAVHYLEGERIVETEIRTSIKEVSEVLNDYPNVMRCHRAYIVNLNQVAEVERRVNGLVLNLQYKHLQVPVSKSYQLEVKTRLQNPDKY